MKPSPLLTIDQVAEYLGVSRQRLYAWRHEGKGPPAIALEGRLLRFDPAELNRWVEQQQSNGQVHQ